MPNQILVIAPYWLEEVQTWVFDDERVGLVQEPFVSSIPQMIDDLVKDIPTALQGFGCCSRPPPIPATSAR